MRLNGKAEIMRYLGASPDNWRAWVGVKMQYGRVIWVRRAVGGHKSRYWTRAEWLDAVDREQGKCVHELEYDHLVQTRNAHLRMVREAKVRIQERYRLSHSRTLADATADALATSVALVAR